MNRGRVINMASLFFAYKTYPIVKGEHHEQQYL